MANLHDFYELVREQVVMTAMEEKERGQGWLKNIYLALPPFTYALVCSFGEEVLQDSV